jgi:hypothetical protein
MLSNIHRVTFIHRICTSRFCNCEDIDLTLEAGSSLPPLVSGDGFAPFLEIKFGFLGLPMRARVPEPGSQVDDQDGVQWQTMAGRIAIC